MAVSITVSNKTNTCAHVRAYMGVDGAHLMITRCSATPLHYAPLLTCQLFYNKRDLPRNCALLLRLMPRHATPRHATTGSTHVNPCSCAYYSSPLRFFLLLFACFVAFHSAVAFSYTLLPIP